MTWSTDPDTRAMVREHEEIEEKRMEWSREKDRIIAEKCEGWTHVEGGSATAMRDASGALRFLPKYNTELLSVVRAAEAWRKQDENARNWSIVSPEYGDTVMRGTCYNGRNPNWRTKNCYDAQPAAALAHALYQAVTQ